MATTSTPTWFRSHARPGGISDVAKATPASRFGREPYVRLAPTRRPQLPRCARTCATDRPAISVTPAEAALRAERELIERQVAARVVDAPLQRDRPAPVGVLGRHQAEHRDLVLRARSAAARSCRRGRCRIRAAADDACSPANSRSAMRVVVALAMPLRHHLAGGRDRSCADCRGRHGCRRSRRRSPRSSALSAAIERCEIGVGILAARAHALERDLVDIGGVAGRIDLDVAAAGLDQARDDLRGRSRPRRP